MSVLDLAYTDTRFHGRASTPKEKKGPCPDPNCVSRSDGFCVREDDPGKFVFQCRGCWPANEILALR